ncbi:aminopeptidase P family protein [Brevibacillus fulvus]|uniref:aminopeptidase P family protein n=1 Tax=Brevibacillus fulvus TaxID=1125967 RepID=UPI003B82EF9B
MEPAFFTAKRTEVGQYLEDDSILVLFSGFAPHKSADATYTFTVNRNFYYLTGVDREQMILLISKQGGKTTETLFIERADPVMEKWVGKKTTVEEARAASGIAQIRFVDQFTVQLNRIMSNGRYRYLYLDLEQTGWDSPVGKAQQFADEMLKRYPYLSVQNVYPQLAKMRTIKSPEEVSLIKKAIEITKQGILQMWEHARPGQMEYQLEAYFNFTLRAAGVKEHAFAPIVASGGNATILHYEENHHPVKDGSLVLLDLGASYQYYNADISRTFPINGKFSERQKLIYQIVLKAELETIKAVKPGVPFRSLNERTKQVLAEELIKIGLIKKPEELSRYYYHGVSHYLGLDTHDVGEYDRVLAPGMVLTIEPGLYIAEEEIGIRIEDDVLVTETGCEVLSQDLIKTVDEIEAFMAKAKQKSVWIR